MRPFLAQILLALILGGTAAAESGVVGRYLAGGGSDVQMLLTIEKPAPAAVIVLQQIPPGVRMTSASPAPSGFVGDGATVKWLIKRPRPGSLLFSMQLSRQVAEDRLQGEISYRQPRTGALVVREISD